MECLVWFLYRVWIHYTSKVLCLSSVFHINLSFRQVITACFNCVVTSWQVWYSNFGLFEIHSETSYHSLRFETWKYNVKAEGQKHHSSCRFWFFLFWRRTHLHIHTKQVLSLSGSDFRHSLWCWNRYVEHWMHSCRIIYRISTFSWRERIRTSPVYNGNLWRPSETHSWKLIS